MILPCRLTRAAAGGRTYETFLRPVLNICECAQVRKKIMTTHAGATDSLPPLEFALIDLDLQVSACDWKHIRGDKPPVVAATPVPKAITVHFPEEVRRQLKSMAAEDGRSMEDIDRRGPQPALRELPQARAGT